MCQRYFRIAQPPAQITNLNHGNMYLVTPLPLFEVTIFLSLPFFDRGVVTVLVPTRAASSMHTARTEGRF